MHLIFQFLLKTIVWVHYKWEVLLENGTLFLRIKKTRFFFGRIYLLEIRFYWQVWQGWSCISFPFCIQAFNQPVMCIYDSVDASVMNSIAWSLSCFWRKSYERTGKIQGIRNKPIGTNSHLKINWPIKSRVAYSNFSNELSFSATLRSLCII